MDKWLYRLGVRSASAATLPDFLGIGAQKSGTSWLYENLRRHPELFLPEPKELHYFDQGFDKPLEFYARYFEPAGARKKGEITPAYAILDRRRIRFIRCILPELKLIFLMRNPIERAWSHAVMNLVQQPGRAMNEVEEAEFLAHFRDERALKRGDYLRTLDNWLAFFPRERLYIDVFEEIAQNPQRLLCRVFAHLGVNQQVDWKQFPYAQVVFKGPDHSLPDRFRPILEEIYRPQIERLIGRFDDPRLNDCIQRWLA